MSESIDRVRHDAMANAIRFLAADAVEKAKSGHPGMPIGMADVATVLFDGAMRYDASAPRWPDRDRFVLSAGHGSMLLYALLHLTGAEDMPLDELKRFRQLHAKTAGHPEFGEAAGIETTTGPLGQGIATAVGFALAERMMNARFGDDLVDHRTYVIAGDGCLMEGISHEAISLAGHLRLHKLTVLFDDNAISIDGSTELAVSDDQLARFAASGWDVAAVDGHDPGAVAAALAAAQQSDRPSLIACKTTIARGAPTKAGTAGAHGSPLGAEEIAGLRAHYGWDHGPFVIPEASAAPWRAAGARGQAAREAWEARVAALPDAERAELERRLAGTLPPDAFAALDALKARWAEERPKLATRASSGKVLDALVPAMPELIGGSADLTGSNKTRAGGVEPVGPGAYGGAYVHYGVREHAMAATMNGLALHGGIVPFGGTFLVFADYMRGGMRLSALMKQRVVYVLTHDSIGLGEDGPTHQPVETLAMLRATPNLHVYRPADAIEVAECWELALRREDGPSVLALTRQGLPTLRSDVAENRSAHGAYVLAEAEGARQATILATGSEVEIAMAARDQLASAGVSTAVVSMPSWERFAAQDAAYRAEVLGTAPRVAVEAAAAFGWTRWTGADEAFVGMRSFGASAPAADLYAHFGITTDAVAAAVRARLL
ncbi:MAG: transketolase [Myxococcota bacterium]